jgi:hypothetical protein
MPKNIPIRVPRTGMKKLGMEKGPREDWPRNRIDVLVRKDSNKAVSSGPYSCGKEGRL